MDPKRLPDPPAVRPTALIHQEGVLGLIAVIGLALRENGGWLGVAPVGSLDRSVALGVAAGLAGAGGLWLLRRLPALTALLEFQRRLVRDWTVTDAVAVALLSGIAEEALLRALLQPLIGLLPAAMLFAVLHVVPDRRLWLWPVIALVLGIVLGLLFECAGYPAAATAHVVINGCALVRLQRHARE